MKQVVLLTTMYLTLMLLIGCRSSPGKNTADDTTTGFVGDSGYITLQNIRTTLIIPAEDTLFRMYEDWKPADTIGKYYKMANGNYIASTAIINSNNFEANIICEAKPDGSILRQEEYATGLYRCCWANKYDGFQRHGDYYAYATCGTGSAYCGGDIYVFKEVKQQRGQDVIFQYEWRWTGRFEEYRNLNSTMEVVGDTIIMHYTIKLYTETESRKRQTKKITHFTAKYLQQNGKWVANDTVKLNKFLYL